MQPNRNLGSDRVTRRGEELVVDSPVDMADWAVRNYRKPAIIFEGRKYYVARKDVLGVRTIRYLLQPWPPETRDIPGKTIHYDEHYVRRRDEALRHFRRTTAVHYALLLLMPLIGFLPSWIKERIEARFEISARRATSYSLALQLVLFLAHGVLIVAFAVANLYFLSVAVTFVGVSTLAYSVAMTVALLLDLLVRYGSILREDRSPYGFFEWLIRPRRGP